MAELRLDEWLWLVLLLVLILVVRVAFGGVLSSRRWGGRSYMATVVRVASAGCGAWTMPSVTPLLFTASTAKT